MYISLRAVSKFDLLSLLLDVWQKNKRENHPLGVFLVIQVPAKKCFYVFCLEISLVPTIPVLSDLPVPKSSHCVSSPDSNAEPIRGQSCRKAPLASLICFLLMIFADYVYIYIFVILYTHI